MRSFSCSSWTRSEIIGELQKCDRAWAESFNVDIEPRRLEPVPWIRKYWPSSEAILEYASRQKPTRYPPGNDAYYQSYIMIDSGWEASTCTVATWIKSTTDDEYVMVAARVPMSIANLVLTLVDIDFFSDASNPLQAALGDEAYEENKVDFYKDHKVVKPSADPRPYEPPTFLPKDLRMSNSNITVVSLLHLEDEVVQNLTLRIKTGSGSDVMPEIQFINWEGDSPTRQQLVKLFDWIDSHSREDGRVGYMFLVDNILQEWVSEGKRTRRTRRGNRPTGARGHADEKKTERLAGPQIVAASRSSHFGNKVLDHQISLLPVRPEGVVPLWQAACQSSQASDQRTIEGRVADVSLELEHGNIFGRERVVDLDYRLDPADDGMSDFATVWFLRPFSLEEERRIRRAFASLYFIEEGQDWGKEFAYIDYLWPSAPPDPAQSRSLQDLCELFQQSDSMSPFYNPKDIGLRMDSYPHHFFAVDDRIFEAKDPRTWLAGSLAGYNDESNYLGWHAGVIPPEEAGSASTNLGIANLSIDELVGEGEKIWLGDIDPRDPDVQEQD